jgi:hypothetical protein
MMKRLHILWIGMPIIAILFSWDLFFEFARKTIVGREATPQSLHVWWLVIGVLYALVFALTAGFLLVFFRLLRRRIAVFLKIACIANAFVAWLLLGLSAVTSDQLVVAAVSPLGLAHLTELLWFLGMIWWAPTLYILFRVVDASPPTLE